MKCSSVVSPISQCDKLHDRRTHQGARERPLALSSRMLNGGRTLSQLRPSYPPSFVLCFFLLSLLTKLFQPPIFGATHSYWLTHSPSSLPYIKDHFSSTDLSSYPEDGGSRFLWNICNTALHSRGTITQKQDHHNWTAVKALNHWEYSIVFGYLHPSKFMFSPQQRCQNFSN
jgi:hypothetical protein